jgi:Domain of unknown function (DUF4365)
MMFMRLKQRTRQHIIADLSVNHVERQALLCGYAAERVRYDYGYDLAVWTYTASGAIEPGQLLVQVKATDAINCLADRTRIALRLDQRDLNLWLGDFLPVFLILYDAQADIAYWIYIQAYFRALGPAFDPSQIGQTYTVYFNSHDILSLAAIEKFAEYKRRVVSQRNNQSGDIGYEN